jgi:hypothetical protein
VGLAVVLGVIGCAADSGSNSHNTGVVGAPVGTGGVGALAHGSGGVPGTAGHPGGTMTTGMVGKGSVPGTGGVTGSGGVGTIVMGSGGVTGSGGMTGAGAVVGPSRTTSKDPKIPDIKGDCPTFAEGTATMDFMGLSGVIFEVGPKSEGTGTLVFYWHGTGSFAGEYASSTFQAEELADLKAQGGILVSPQSGLGSGGDCSGTGTFAMDDFNVSDQIAACAVRDWGIDPHRIFASGCSAGGLQSGCMAMMRSSYMAGAVPNSGGEVFPIAADDPSHTPSMLTIHGMMGSDVVIVDFSQTSATMDDAIKMAGGFAVDCDHGGGHCGLPLLPPEAAAAGWQFMKDHPFGVDPEPYATMLPSSFPSYCKIW